MDKVPVSQRMDIFNTVTSSTNFATQGTASNAVALRQSMDAGLVKPSEMEKTGGGYNKFILRQSIKEMKFLQNLKKYDKKTGGVKESVTRRLLNPQHVLKEQPEPGSSTDLLLQSYHLRYHHQENLG